VHDMLGIGSVYGDIPLMKGDIEVIGGWPQPS